MAYIKATNVCVDYPLYGSEQRSLKRLISRPAARSRFGTDHRERFVLHALKNIELTLRDGDRVALVGANGSGKSTLLRVLAGVYPPVFGSVTSEGKVGALLTTGLGMRDDASGYENIDFCLLLQGVPAGEIPALRAQIADFTELGDYLELHVGAYSAGMRVRLAFSISTAINPDILIIDEAFGTGDASFLRKAQKRMEDLIQQSKILVFATHVPTLAEQFCDRALWLDNGEIRCDGPISEVTQKYLSSAR